MVKGTTVRASVSAKGKQVKAGVRDGAVAISANGRYVAFSSLATNLVKGDKNKSQDVFVRDLVKRKTVNASGHFFGYSSAPALSKDGRYVAYTSTASTTPTTRSLFTVVVHDLRENKSRLVCRDKAGAIARGHQPTFGAAGAFVGFSCEADLVAGDTNLSSDAFVYGPLR